MSSKRLAGIVVLLVIFIMGCSGNYGKFKPQTETESKVTQRELIDNWSNYDIWVNYNSAPRLGLIVFDPKNDDRKILVGRYWDTVKDQETWAEIVNANTTSDGEFFLPYQNYDYGTSRVQEIRSSDNQLYGYLIYQTWVVGSMNVKMVDENTMQLSWVRWTGTRR